MTQTNDDKQYWFRTKKYGWGWGLPRTRQGWAVLGAVIVVWLAALAVYSTISSTRQPSVLETALFVAVLVADLSMLVYFSFKHGEKPAWRWGNKK